MMSSVSQEDLKSFAEIVCGVLQHKDNQEFLSYKWNSNKAFDLAHTFLKEKINSLVFESSSDEEKTLELRRAASSCWNEISMDDKFKLFEWIVKKWGGIRSIGENTLNTYVKNINCLDSESPECESAKKFIFNAEENISSKSKCLAFLYPDKYFIYDSRVSMALIRILLKSRSEYTWKFPLPSGQSKDFKELKNCLTNRIGTKRKPKVTYLQYCELIKMISELLGEGDSQLIEMKLFMLGKHVKKFHIPNPKKDSPC